VYLAHRTYLWLKTNSALENPDQRIAEDIKTLSSSTLSLLLMVLNSIFTVVAFAGVLWSISPVLFGVAAGYAALGSFFTILLGKPLVWRTYKQFDYEAALRSELVHVRESAESIALRHAEHGLLARLQARVTEVCDNVGQTIRINRNLAFFTTGYNYLIQIIPALIVAPMFIHGSVPFGVIPQSAMAFTALVSAFSLIVNQVQSISNYVAVAARVKVTIDATASASKEKSFDICLVNDASRLALEKLTLQVPGGDHALVRELSLEVAPGALVLVQCAQAASATALFHAVAGLWDCGAGTIIRPGLHNIFFLPGKPYLPPGTLRQAMQAPSHQMAGDDDMRAVLAGLGAADVIEKAGGLDIEQPWASLLSLSEQQLVSVACIALAAPAFVVIELIESTLSHVQLHHVFSVLQRKGVGVLVIDQDHCGLDDFPEVVQIDGQGISHAHG
jgi:putative ATP-binding cassette transporter